MTPSVRSYYKVTVHRRQCFGAFFWIGAAQYTVRVCMCPVQRHAGQVGLTEDSPCGCDRVRLFFTMYQPFDNLVKTVSITQST